MILTIILALSSLTCNDAANSNSTIEEKDQVEIEVPTEAAEKVIDSTPTTASPQAKVTRDGGDSRENKEEHTEHKEPARERIEPTIVTSPTVVQQNEKSNDQDDKPEAKEVIEIQPEVKQIELPKSTGGEVLPEPTAMIDLAGPDHSLFNDLLQNYVTSGGKVNYAGIKSDVAKLDDYIKLLQDNPVSSDWSRNARLAYWINAYNAFTIKLIIDNYPLNSIMDLDGGKPWDKSWISIGDKSYSLNDIEHKIIRPKFNDPRIHFAVNCAAKSCPPIANKAYTESNVTSLLEQRTKQFINDGNYNHFEGGQVKISKIFDWYGEDFGDLNDYLNKYLTTKIESDTDISFLDYNWNLNN